MLTNTTYFPALGGTRRPLIAAFTSDNETEVAGVTAVATLHWYNVCYAGDTLIISFGSTVITFTATATPSHDPGTDLPTAELDVADIAGYLDDNYLLTLYFDISYDTPNDRITFTAKATGSAYTITFGGTMLGENYSEHANTAGVNAVPRPNFQVWADLYIEPTYLSGVFSTLAGKLSATRAADGKYYFDVSALVDGYVADHQPILDDIAIRVASESMLVRYLIRAGEAYGSPIAPQGFATKISRTALRGRNAIETVGTAGNTLPTGTYAAQGFMPLTGRPLSKKVTKAQNEFLYLLTTSGSNWSISGLVTFTDGTTGAMTPLTPATVTAYQVYALPMGYTQLGIGAVNPAKTVRSYTVNISLGDPTPTGDISLTFELMGTCPPHMRYLIFRNELGGYDTIQLQGALQKSGQADRQRGQYILPANYTALSRQAFDYDTSSQDEYEAHTGYYLTKEEAEYYLRQLIQSENVLLHDGSNLVPVTLTTKEANYTRDKYQLYGMALKFQRSQKHMDQHTSYLT